MLAFQTCGGQGESDTFLTIKETTSTTTRKATHNRHNNYNKTNKQNDNDNDDINDDHNDNDNDNEHKKIEIRGDASTITFESTLRVRMQARFKPQIKASKESKAKEKISRKELEATVGRRLEDHEVRRLKKAKREGNYYEEVLDVRVKGKHDKFAS